MGGGRIFCDPFFVVSCLFGCRGEGGGGGGDGGYFVPRFLWLFVHVVYLAAGGWGGVGGGEQFSIIACLYTDSRTDVFNHG